MNNSLKLFLAILLILSACSSNAKQANSPDLENKQVTTESETDNDSDKTITSQNIGQAEIGMTFGSLKQIVSPDTEFQPEPEFMVDVRAIAVTRSGKIEYYLAFPASEEIRDDSIITYLITQNPQYHTKDGVKVGMTIAEAEAIYGTVTLSYNVENESREYLKFPEAQLKNIRFRPNNFELTGLAGIYTEQKAYNQTEKYRQDAKVFSIEVACVPIDCPQP